jgi:hypothetical protein
MAWDLLATATVSGTSTKTISFTSINQGYKDLCLVGMLRDNYTNSSNFSNVTYYMKTAAGGAMSISGGRMQMAYNSTTPESNQYGGAGTIGGVIPGNPSGDSASGCGPQYMYVYDYSSTTVAKNMYIFSGIIATSTYNAANTWRMQRWIFNDGSNNPVGQIDITTAELYFLPDCVMSLYGIEG